MVRTTGGLGRSGTPAADLLRGEGAGGRASAGGWCWEGILVSGVLVTGPADDGREGPGWAYLFGYSFPDSYLLAAGVSGVVSLSSEFVSLFLNGCSEAVFEAALDISVSG